jgi:hypothetical protein
MRPLSRSVTLFVLMLAAAAGGSTTLRAVQTTQKPPTQTTKPPQKPPTQTAKPPQKPATQPAKPAEPAKAPVAVAPQDLKYAATYTAEDLKTASFTFVKGPRERFEFQDIVLLKQHDLKRTIQIMKAANTYLVVADGAPAVPDMPGSPAAPPRPAGVVNVITTIVDTGERKTAFGQQARRVKTMIDRQPMPGACDTSKARIETDGWYIDQPKALVTQTAETRPASGPIPGGCADQVQATVSGDGTVLGFPIAYTTTIRGDDGKSIVTSMEVTAFEMTTLDAALFEIPPGLNAAMNIGEMAKALSDVNETRLVDADTAPPATPRPKAPGAIRIGVPEFTNKAAQSVNTRAMRQQLIAELVEAKLDAVPMAAATPADLQTRAQQLGYDYVLFGEVAELKASKPGAMGGLMKKASGGGGAGAPQENTEATIAIKLVQPDGKQRLETKITGKDGGGFSMKTGLGLAKFAGSMYLTMIAGPQMFAHLNSYGAANLGGMSMLGNPMLTQMQMGGLGGLGRGAGIDATAGAASYLLVQGMAMNNVNGLVGAPGSGPSFDKSLGNATEDAAKAVAKALSAKK